MTFVIWVVSDGGDRVNAGMLRGMANVRTERMLLTAGVALLAVGIGLALGHGAELAGAGDMVRWVCPDGPGRADQGATSARLLYRVDERLSCSDMAMAPVVLLRASGRVRVRGGRRAKTSERGRERA